MQDQKCLTFYSYQGVPQCLCLLNLWTVVFVQLLCVPLVRATSFANLVIHRSGYVWPVSIASWKAICSWCCFRVYRMGCLYPGFERQLRHARFPLRKLYVPLLLAVHRLYFQEWSFTCWSDCCTWCPLDSCGWRCLSKMLEVRVSCQNPSHFSY